MLRLTAARVQLLGDCRVVSSMARSCRHMTSLQPLPVGSNLVDWASRSPPSRGRTFADVRKINSAMDMVSVLKDDTTNLHERTMTVLRQYITNQEVLDICSHYYKGEADNLFICMGAMVIIGKALKFHMFNDGELTEMQKRVLTVCELSAIFYFLHDDIVDNSKTRFGSPSAHTLWDPYKVVLAGKIVLTIAVSEAAKLNADIAVTMCQMHEGMFRGQFMTDNVKQVGENRWSQYRILSRYKSGYALASTTKALAQALNASPLLTDNVVDIVTNIGLMGQMLDDFKDIEDDLRQGVATATVLFAMREYPIIEEMILRQFKGKGDVERTLEMVRNSGAIEETKDLVRCHHDTAMRYVKMLAPSTYRDALEVISGFEMNRKINYHDVETSHQVKRAGSETLSF